MFNVEANLNLYGLAGTGAVVNVTVNLDEVTTSDNFKAPQTLLGTSATTLYTAPSGGPGLVKSVVGVNTSASPVTTIQLFKGASAVAGTRISGNFTVPANGFFAYTGDVLNVYDATGALVTQTQIAFGTVATKNVGNTVLDPDTGKLEFAMPSAGLVAGASKTYASTDRGYIYRRSNSGAAMSDTLPALTNTTADIGYTITLYNEDTVIAGLLTVSASGGALFRSATGTTSATSPMNYGTRQQFVWDGTQWLLTAGNANIVRRSGAIVAGNFPQFLDTAGNIVTDSGVSATTVASKVASVGATDSSIVVGGTATAPTIQRAALTGDVTAGAGVNATVLKNTGPGATGPFGTSGTTPTVTIDAQGRITGLTSTAITPAGIGAPSGSGTHSGTSSNTNTGDQTTSNADGTIGVATGTTNPVLTRPAITGDVSIPVASNAATLATFGPGAVGPFGTAGRTPVITTDAKGRVSALTDIAITPAGIGAPSGSGTHSGTSSGTNTGDQIIQATGWIDVTKAATPVLTGNTPAQNITAINAILAAASAGNTIYFPGGTYQFNAAWTMPAGKQFNFQGQGSGGTGGNTLLEWTANVGGDIITLPAGIWYWNFSNLTFCVAAGITQSAGALVNINGQASTNFFNCTFASVFGGFWNDVLVGTTPGAFPSNQSWNTAVIQNCVLSGYKGRGIFVDSAAASLVVENCVIQGQWGPTSGSPAAASALAGVEAQNCGALQITMCDILGNVNNILLDPAVGKVCASVFCVDTYFDSSAGSCFKIAGAGATVRSIFAGCSFTTAGTNFTTAGTNFSAIEIGGSFAYTAGGQSTSFTDCNILNTFGTTGTSNGVTFTGTSGDTYFTGCKVAGWTNGYNIAASGTNLTLVKVLGGACGPTAGYGANSVGFNVAAGAYKGLQIQGVNAHGNTTNLTLGAVTVATGDASLFRISDNTGINPRGAVTTPAVAASTVATTNTTGFRVTVFLKNGSTAPTVVNVNGVVITGFTTATVSAAAGQIMLDPGGTITMTYTVVPTWIWVAN